MARSLEDIKRRVRALLATATPKSGATDPERATARRLADGLIATHGLRESEIPLEAEPRRAAAPTPPPMGGVVIIINGAAFSFGVDGFGPEFTPTNSSTGSPW